MSPENPRALLRALFDRAVAVADPMRIVPAHLPPRPPGRVLVVGAGKASARMAEAVESAWGPCEGLVVTRHGHGRPTRGIEVVEAGHPVPDRAGLEATERILRLLDGAGEGDLVLALISGGASALLVAPAEGVSLADKRAVNAALLASGAPISAMNLVRKHLSRVKGGQLAARAWPARLLALAISDVPGDDPAVIGSGPTVGDASTTWEARAALARWGIEPPASVARALARPSGVIPLGDPRLARTETRVIAAPAQSLAAAAALAREAGCEVRVLGDAIEGEARDEAARQAALARAARAAMAPGDPPLLLLSGGELTVTRRGDGVGGPNAEFALALALALDGAPGLHALAGDSDGIDGAAEVAGAAIGPDTLARARVLELDARAMLDANDAHSFFARLGDQVVTGPTLTNVNDIRAILVLPPGPPGVGAEDVELHLDAFRLSIEEASPVAAIRLAGDPLGCLTVGESSRGCLGDDVIDHAAPFDALLDIGDAGDIAFEPVPEAVMDQSQSRTGASGCDTRTASLPRARHAKSFIDPRLEAAARRRATSARA